MIHITLLFAEPNKVCFMSRVATENQMLYDDLRLMFTSNMNFGFMAVPVKLLDWGEDGHRSEQDIAAVRAAFSQEVTVWHKLDHPNVTKVLLGSTSHCLFL